jgi:hypothetical protein
MLSISKADYDRARRIARRAGLMVCKNRQQCHGNNLGGLMLFDPYRNAVVAGARFDLSADDVEVWATDLSESEGPPGQVSSPPKR